MKSKPFIIGLGTSLLFLWLALRDVDTAALTMSFRDADARFTAPFIISLGIFYWLKAIRWRLLTHSGFKIRTNQLIPSMMIGFAANNVLPFRAGELIRVFAANSSLNLPKTYFLATIFVERIFDIFAIAVIVIIGLVYITTGDAFIGDTSRMIFVLLILVTACLLSFFLLSNHASILSRFIRHLPRRANRHLSEYIKTFEQGLEPALENRKLVYIIVNSIIQWALLAFCVYLSFVSFDLELPYASATLLLGIMTVGIALPSGPAYIGTIEYSFVLGLSFFGIDADRSLACAIYYHALSFVFVTSLGLIFYLTQKRKPSTLPL